MRLLPASGAAAFTRCELALTQSTRLHQGWSGPCGLLGALHASAAPAVNLHAYIKRKAGWERSRGQLTAAQECLATCSATYADSRCASLHKNCHFVSFDSVQERTRKKADKVVHLVVHMTPFKLPHVQQPLRAWP